jgi:hypothetical protein
MSGTVSSSLEAAGQQRQLLGFVLFCFVLVWFGLVWWAFLLTRV